MHAWCVVYMYMELAVAAHKAGGIGTAAVHAVHKKQAVVLQLYMH